ncbi:MAG: hypothetical protein NDI93_07085 [Pseudomonas sp.]|nr:hypothetical protein [Pseudomonas sp.]
MAKVGRVARRKRNRELIRATGLGLLLLAVLSMGGYFFAHRDIAPDRATLCPASGPLGHYVVLVDNTDPYNFMQRQAFLQSLTALAEEKVEQGHLLSIYVLGAEVSEHATPVFEKCNPGIGAGKSEMTANLARIKKRFEDEFKKPILKLSESVLVDKPSDRSPIFEMLQIASINGFRAKDVQGDRVLVIFSDMLPNTQEFSMFKGYGSFSSFLDSHYGRKSQTDLGGVKVEVNYLLNYPKLQTRSQLSFWEEYFKKAGARLVSVKTLEG